MSDGLVPLSRGPGPQSSLRRGVPVRLEISDHPEPRAPESFDGPVWDQPWIDPDFGARLFPAAEAEVAQRTILLLDAGLRARTWGVFDPDDVDVPCECLFQGQAARDLKSVAPYLIDLSLPPGTRDDAGAVPQFHKEFFSRDWASETGILIRTDLEMGAIRRHFRRFTKVTTPAGTVAYFRFWDPRLLMSFLQASTSEELQRFFPSAATTLWTVTRSDLFGTTTLRSASVVPA